MTTRKLSSILGQCSLKCVVTFFFTNGNFQAAFVEFRFIMFTKVLMIELARILIHVYKTFKRRVSFKMPLSMYLVSVEN